MSEKMVDYCPMWESLGMDVEAHGQLMNVLPGMFQEAILDQPHRPQAMDYFDLAMMEVHGARIREILDRKQAGDKVVGAFCLFVPEEIVLAAGAIMVGLCAGADIGAAEAEKYLPRNICPLVKSSLGFKLSRMCPYFQSSDLVVGETTCDGKKKMYEILREYSPMYVMELPQTKSPQAQALWLREVNDFKNRIEALTGKRITAKALGEAIRTTNQRRRALQRISQARRASPPPISGRDAVLVTMIAFLDDVERFSRKAEALCTEIEARAARGEGVVERSAPRIMISGTPMTAPNWKLPHLIESAGAVVVCEEACTGQRLFRDLVNESEGNLPDQISAIADRYMKNDCACFTPNEERVGNIIRLAQEYHVDGVVYGVLHYCQPYAIEFHRVEAALKKAGVPVLNIEYDYGAGDMGQLKTRIEAFVEMLRKA